MIVTAIITGCWLAVGWFFFTVLMRICTGNKELWS